MGETQSNLNQFTLPKFEEATSLSGLHLTCDSYDFLYAKTEELGAMWKACHSIHSFSGENGIPGREEEVMAMWNKCQFVSHIFAVQQFEDSTLEQRALRVTFFNTFLKEMLEVGRCLVMTPKLLRKSEYNYSSFIWSSPVRLERERTEDWHDMQCEVMSLELLYKDILGVSKMDKSMVKEFINYVKKDVPIDIELCSEESQQYHEMSLSGNPWNVSGKYAGYGRQLLLSALEFLSSKSWEFYGSGNIGNEESIYFRKSKHISPHSGRGAFFLVSLEQFDMIRLVTRDDPLNQHLRESLCQGWTKYGGLTSVASTDGTILLRLQGSPWRHNRLDKEGVETKVMLTQLFQDYWHEGWKVVGAIEKNDYHKSIFIFQACYPAKKVHVIGISLVGKWLLRIFNCPRALIDRIKEILHQKWYREVLVEEVTESCWIFTLGGYPWCRNVVPAFALLLHIVDRLQRHGYNPLLSARVSGVHEKGSYNDTNGRKRTYEQAELHTLWFAKI